MATLDMRHSARECVTRARTLLNIDDEPSARYACFELRSAIEYLTYDHLVTYRDELDYETVKKWQPRELIVAMREIDPNADMGVELQVGPKYVPGEPPPTEGYKSLGREHRFSLKWVTENYNALGSYLHSPTLDRIETGRTPKVEEIIGTATKVLNECEQVLQSPIFRVNMGMFFSRNCMDCNTPMKGRLKDPTQKQEMVCPNSKCGAVYNIECNEQQQIIRTMRQSNYVCPQCNAENWIGIHRVVAGAIITCRECRKQVRVVSYGIEAVDDE
jgi:ribosomal protein L37AE/L43A